MTATGSGRGSETEPSGDSALDHAYFQAVEEIFIRLRGAPLLLSPADWRVAREWRRAGIPLALVGRALEDVFARRAERGEERPVRSLRYCRSAVEAAWKDERELTATAGRLPTETIDVASRLGALAAALPEAARQGGLAEELETLGGAPPTVEAALAELDRRLLDWARGQLEETELAAIGADVDSSLAALADRLSAEEREGARERLIDRRLRARLDLPTLSLFAQ